MEAGFYEINSIGNKMPGASGAIEVLMAGIAKDDSAEHYSVVNEYVCSRLAAAVGLPVPPGTIAKKADGKNVRLPAVHGRTYQPAARGPGRAGGRPSRPRRRHHRLRLLGG